MDDSVRLVKISPGLGAGNSSEPLFEYTDSRQQIAKAQYSLNCIQRLLDEIDDSNRRKCYDEVLDWTLKIFSYMDKYITTLQNRSGKKGSDSLPLRCRSLYSYLSQTLYVGIIYQYIHRAGYSQIFRYILSNESHAHKIEVFSRVVYLLEHQQISIQIVKHLTNKELLGMKADLFERVHFSKGYFGRCRLCQAQIGLQEPRETSGSGENSSKNFLEKMVILQCRHPLCGSCLLKYSPKEIRDSKRAQPFSGQTSLASQSLSSLSPLNRPCPECPSYLSKKDTFIRNCLTDPDWIVQDVFHSQVEKNRIEGEVSQRRLSLREKLGGQKMSHTSENSPSSRESLFLERMYCFEDHLDYTSAVSLV